MAIALSSCHFLTAYDSRLQTCSTATDCNGNGFQVSSCRQKALGEPRIIHINSQLAICAYCKQIVISNPQLAHTALVSDWEVMMMFWNIHIYYKTWCRAHFHSFLTQHTLAITSSSGLADLTSITKLYLYIWLSVHVCLSEITVLS